MTDTAQIPLSKGRIAIVDAADAQWLLKSRWHVWTGRIDGTHEPRIEAQTKWLHGASRGVRKLHRVVADVDDPKVIVLAMNGDALDCRRENLRVCTYSEFRAHDRRMKPPSAISRYRGVHPHHTGRWRACVSVNNRQRVIGIFKTERDAALAYNTAALQLHGDLARLNQLEAA